MATDSTGQDWKNTEGDKLTEKYGGNTISFIGVVTAALLTCDLETFRGILAPLIPRKRR